MQKSRWGLAGKSLGALAAAGSAVLVIGGCSTAARHPARLAVHHPVTSTAEHWGSLFGGTKGYFGQTASPVTVTLPGTVTKVASSNSTEYALLTDGALYAWGLGSQGQLGDGATRNSITPVRVRFPAGVKIASIPTDVMPFDTGLAVDTHGHAWGWGDNGGGELCLGNRKTYRTPVRLPFSSVTALAGASNHTQFDAGGTLYACGQNLSGSLGDGSTRPSTTPVKVAGLNGSSVVGLMAAFANSGALLSDGAYYDWGLNTAGQLGDGHHKQSDVPVRVSLPGPVAQAAQGGSYWNNGQSLALLSNGSVWAWGDGKRGQLGRGTVRSRRSPGRVHVPAGVSFARLATGGATSYAISATGDVYAWGASYLGQVGNGESGIEPVPVLVASGATSISATASNVVINVPAKEHTASRA